jgi:peroxiredoxin
MKLLLNVLLLLCTLFSSAQSGKNGEDILKQLLAKQKESIGKPLPEFAIKTGDSVLTNQSLKGKTVFINFWFEACPPCIIELDGLNELYTKTKDQQDFAFLSFTFEKPEKCSEMRKKYNLQYPIISITREECYLLNGKNGFPTNLLLDKSGVVHHLASGGAMTKKEATAFLMTEFYARILQLLQVK